MKESLPLNLDPVAITCSQLGYQAGHDPKVTILEDVSFKAASGSLIGIIGPNGAGKSTLLRQIGGLIRPTSGEISCNGRRIDHYKPRMYARVCSFMHQNTVMPFDFAVRDVVMMGRHPYSSSLASFSHADEAYVERCMAIAGCLPDADKRVTTLSGGERQRVMFARALAQDTPLMLLDEPTASLDIHHANHVFLLMRQLADAGKLVISVMHDLRAAAKYCDTLFLMVRGRLVAAGDPEDVLHEGHISYAFGIKATTFRNPLGNWDFDVDDLQEPVLWQTGRRVNSQEEYRHER